MKFACDCGHVIRDQTDNLQYKGTLLPDEGSWDNVQWPIVQAVVEYAKSLANGDAEAWLRKHFGPNYPRDLDDDSIISDMISAHLAQLRPMYQCTQCGSLFVQKKLGGHYVKFSPEDADWQNILSWDS